jgi:hypothetical protein
MHALPRKKLLRRKKLFMSSFFSKNGNGFSAADARKTRLNQYWFGAFLCPHSSSSDKLEALKL